MNITEIEQVLKTIGVEFADGVSTAEKSTIVSGLFAALGLEGDNATGANLLSLAGRAADVITGAVKVAFPNDPRILLPVSAADEFIHKAVAAFPEYAQKLNEIHSMLSEIHSIFSGLVATVSSTAGEAVAAGQDNPNSLGSKVLSFLGIQNNATKDAGK